MDGRRQGSRGVRALVGGLAGAALLGVLALGLAKGFSSDGGHALAATATPASILSRPLSPEERTCIDRFEGGLTNFSKIPLSKRAGEEAGIEICANSLKHPAPRIVHYAPPSPATTPRPFPQGIFETGQAAFPSSGFTFINQWQAERGRVRLAVYAGSISAESSQGILVVQVFSPANVKPTPLGFYPTSMKAGPVHISAVSGGRLALSSTSGATFTFDVDARSYMSP